MIFVLYIGCELLVTHDIQTCFIVYSVLKIATSLQFSVYSPLYLDSHGCSVGAPRRGPDTRRPQGHKPPHQADHVADQQAGAVAPFTGPVVRSQMGVLRAGPSQIC